MIPGMKSIAILLVFTTMIFADSANNLTGSAAADETKLSDIEPTPHPHPKPTTTAAPTTAQPTTPTKPTTPAPTKPTTTPAPTTPTTPAPTTPTTPPPTTPTTPPPTTPTKPTPTTPTTPAPTTPTTPTTPAPAPTTPAPPPKDWIVSGPDGTVCITANMVIKINVPYKSFDNKTVKAEFDVVKVNNATATGTCGNQSQELVLSWDNVQVNFNFSHNTSDPKYSLISVDVKINVNNVTFPNNTMTNATVVDLKYVGNVFSVPIKNSYTCTKVDPLSLEGNAWNKTVPLANSTIAGTLSVSNVHVQAFNTGKSEKYLSPLDCATGETPDFVPIAVGLILAGLVVVVLIAYLVGRRRAQARGYLSM